MKKITVYSTEACAFCNTEKQWLDSLGYKYTSKMVDLDSDHMEELKSIGVGTGVPVTVVGDEVVVGFNRNAILKAIQE